MDTPTIINGQPNLFTMPVPPNVGFNTSYNQVPMHQNQSNNYNVQPINNYNVQPQITNDYITPQSIIQHGNIYSGLQKDFKQSTFSGDHWRGFISQFLRQAKNQGWTEYEKIENFVQLLRKGAMDYFSALPARKNYDFP
jgi:hypothetical protein